MKKILQDLSFEELETLVLSLGEKKFRAKQLYEGLMQGKTIMAISSLSKALKERLLEEYENEPVRIKETFFSSDGTEKYLFEYADGNLVEGVLMKYKYGYTQCVSTQVGCRMGCKFCASTLNGLVRNLTAGEILSQILIVNALHKEDVIGQGKEARAVTNVVLMGSGEPLDNYDETLKFLRLVTAEGGKVLIHDILLVVYLTDELLENILDGDESRDFLFLVLDDRHLYFMLAHMR